MNIRRKIDTRRYAAEMEVDSIGFSGKHVALAAVEVVAKPGRAVAPRPPRTARGAVPTKVV